MVDKVPRVFISYSHDSDEHKTWVLNFAIQLRSKGVDAVLDQWDLKPGKDVTLFMEEQLSACSFAILVCTERYVEKANSGKGGVGYERMIVSAELVRDIDAGKFIPIIRQRGDRSVPKFIETKLYLDFTNDEYFEAVFDDLLRTIYGAEISTKPPLGQAPSFEEENISSKRHSVARAKSDLSIEAFEVFEQMIFRYDSGLNECWGKETLRQMFNFGRVTLDTALSELEGCDLIFIGQYDGNVYLSDPGKLYAKQISIV